MSGDPCVIDGASYIVINHTTGERFDAISATESSIAETTTNTVQVQGSRISWPDNGWYQVQNATSFTTVCEGGRECVIDAGSYLVINHTTGERFENIIVGLTPPTDGNNNPIVDDPNRQKCLPDRGTYSFTSSNPSQGFSETTTITKNPGDEYWHVLITSNGITSDEYPVPWLDMSVYCGYADL